MRYRAGILIYFIYKSRARNKRSGQRVAGGGGGGEEDRLRVPRALARRSLPVSPRSSYRYERGYSFPFLSLQKGVTPAAIEAARYRNGVQARFRRAHASRARGFSTPMLHRGTSVAPRHPVPFPSVARYRNHSRAASAPSHRLIPLDVTTRCWLTDRH